MVVTLIVGEKRGRFPFSNSLLIKRSREKILVDLGLGYSHLSVLEGIDAVIITHYHPDHISLIGWASPRAKIYAPVLDTVFSTLASLAKRFAPMVWEKWVEMARAMGLPEKLPETKPYDFSEEVLGVQTLHLPGHLQSHHGVLVEDCLYGSDVDLTGFGPWYGNPEASLYQFLNDIVFLASLRPKRYCSSHKEKVFEGREVYEELAKYATKPLENALKMLDAIRAVGEASPRDLAGRGIVYPRIPQLYRDLYLYFEESIIRKTLEYLEHAGLVERKTTGRYVLAKTDYVERIGELKNKIRGEILQYA